MITFRQLRYFTALADHENFGRAADSCAVSQPSLSQQIAELEAELGAQLVDRSGRRATLTDIGRVIADRARSILSSVADLAQVAREGDESSQPLRLGVIPTIAPFLLPQTLPAIRALYERAGVQIREAFTHTLLLELRDNKLDVALLALPLQEHGIETLDLFDDPFFLAVPATANIKGPIEARDVSPKDLLLLDEGHCLRDQALSVCGHAGSEMRAQLGATSLATIASLVRAGLGHTLIPSMAVEALFGADNKSVNIVPFKKPAPYRTIGLAFRSTASNKQAIRRLGNAITNAVKP